MTDQEVLDYAKLWDVDLSRVKGSGANGVVTVADVRAERERYLDQVLASVRNGTAIAASAAVSTVRISASAAKHADGFALKASDLVDVTGTGDDGEITIGDVRASMGLPRKIMKTDKDFADSYGLPVATIAQIRAKIRYEAEHPTPIAASSSRVLASVMAGQRVDPNLNPLVAQVQQQNPQRVQASAATGAPVPTLFNSGDLPPFTSSGIDPSVLLQVPWNARHALAQADTTQEAYRIMQACSGPDAEDGAAIEELGKDWDNAGNADYAARVQAWVNAGVTDEEIEAAWQATPMVQGIFNRGAEQEQRLAASAQKHALERSRAIGRSQGTPF